MVSHAEFEPGEYVRHPLEPGWGLGQVQSAIGTKVTVMFENMGKVVVETAIVTLDRAGLHAGLHTGLHKDQRGMR